MGTKGSKGAGAKVAAEPVNNVIGGVIHYHRDTEPIHHTLVVGSVYNTSKGKGKYKGRSQSNGKLLFVDCETRKNTYFTKIEWVDGKNTASNIDSNYMEQAQVKSAESVKDAVKGLLPNKSVLTDVSPETDDLKCSGEEATYGGITPNGIKVTYHTEAKLVAYFQANEFAKRFKVKDIGSYSAKEIAEMNKPKVSTPSKKKSKKRR